MLVQVSTYTQTCCFATKSDIVLVWSRELRRSHEADAACLGVPSLSYNGTIFKVRRAMQTQMLMLCMFVAERSRQSFRQDLS